MALVWMGGRARVLNNREVRDEARRMRRKAKARLLYSTAWPRRVPVDCGLRRRGGYRRERALAAREAEAERSAVALLRREREADERRARAWGLLLLWTVPNGVLTVALALLALHVALGAVALAVWFTTVVTMLSRQDGATGSGPGGPEAR